MLFAASSRARGARRVGGEGLAGPSSLGKAALHWADLCNERCWASGCPTVVGVLTACVSEDKTVRYSSAGEKEKDEVSSTSGSGETARRVSCDMGLWRLCGRYP